MYNISLERYCYSTSAHVNYIKIHAEMKCKLKIEITYSKDCLCFLTAFSHSLIKYSCYLTHKSYKMVDNKSKTSLIRHIQKKYVTHEDVQYCYLHSWYIFSVYVIQEVFLLSSPGIIHAGK